MKGFFTEAIVLPEDPAIRDQLDFYATLCLNRGFNVRLFEDPDRAVEWLSPVVSSGMQGKGSGPDAP